jgi:predicted amidohydrolase
MICYDLRFPVFSRRSSNLDYNLIINVVHWPKSRSLVLENSFKARAIENQSFVIGCNRVGVDGNKLEYSGDSCIISPLVLL